MMGQNSNQPGQLVLVVDDSATERRFLADLLAERGYQVITAASGDEAVLKVRSQKPQLVVMDVIMPGLSGFQVTRALRRDPSTESIPVILVTQKNAETDRIWGLRQGANEYLIKPIAPNVLLAKVAQLVH